MKTLFLLLCPLVLLYSDSERPQQPANGITPEYASTETTASTDSSLRDRVREIITPKCGSCHTSTLPTAKPKALKIFDLVRADWPSTMSARQLVAFNNRLNSLEKLEKEIIEKFVAVESTLREQANHPSTSNERQ